MYESKLLKSLDVLNKEYREAMLNEDDDLILAIKNQQSAFMLALRLLDNEPIAYSVDKVVKELEEIKGSACDGKGCSECEYTSDCLEGEQSEKVAIDKAIEIVKQGGVSDDVCEWKDKELYGYYTSCTEFRSKIAYKDTFFEYCPYCGKKIKIVGE